MHILVVSPVASHPQHQGNSARIYRFCRQLQAYGYKIHFFYVQYEGLTLHQRAQMAHCWDYFYSVDSSGSGAGGKSFPEYFAVDDWYASKTDDAIRRLQEKWNYRAVIVNYVWLSRSLLLFPDSVFKIIDTHDVFGDRHMRSLAVGLTPEWYFTSTEEEARGLKRANLSIAIQHEEAEYFRSISVNAAILGFVPEPRFLPQRVLTGKPMIGYIGSSNPWNKKSFNDFAARVMNTPAIFDAFDFEIAGSICHRITAPTHFKSLGIVEDPYVFYSSADVVVNPMEGGTGLKIKSVEALSYGRAFLSTRDGTTGISSMDLFHKFESIEALVSGLVWMADNQTAIAEKAAAARKTFLNYAVEQISNLEAIVTAIESHY
jgi:hypothetical protein